MLPAWDRERRDGDVDALAYRSLLEERERPRRRRTDGAAAAPDEPDLPPALADRLERRRELEAHLATLSEAERIRTVLVHVAGLTDDEVDEVTGQPGVTPPLPMAGADVRDACEAVPAPPAPVSGVLAAHAAAPYGMDPRRGGRRTGGGGAGRHDLVDLGRRRPPPAGRGHAGHEPAARPVVRRSTLHLARVDVQVDGVDTLLAVPDGVVYSDSEGRVVHVDDAGRQRTIGETVAGSRLVVEPDNGWVAWADPGDGDPELVVHDTLGRTEVGRRSLGVPGDVGGQPVGEAGPIAIDDERVFYTSADGDFAWEPLIDVSFALSGTMVDTAEDARVTRSEDVLRVTPLPYRTGAVIDADDARLTHDGRYAFGVQETDADRLEVFDVGTGRPVPPLYSPSDEAVSWTYQDGTFYFALLHMLQDKTYQDMLQMPSEGDYRIYACVPGRPQPCEKLAEVPEEVPDPPVFPQ